MVYVPLIRKKHPERPRASSKRITPSMLYSHHLHTRQKDINILQREGHLCQHYSVDQYCKVESRPLPNVRHNQQWIRATDYTSLCEQLDNSEQVENEEEAGRSWQLFVLLSTYIDGGRYVRQNTHDVIAIFNRLGHSGNFLTMTCNPNWPEIPRALIHKHKA